MLELRRDALWSGGRIPLQRARQDMGTILVIIAIFIGFGGVAALGFGIAGLNSATDEAAKSFAMKRVAWGGGGTILAIILFFIGIMV